ncbi:O-methyltransferase domain-containing protein [Trichoderma compactum]
MTKHQTNQNGWSSGHSNGHSTGQTPVDYEEMGRQLLQNMKTYGDYLKLEGSDMPSLSPNALDNVHCTSEPGEVARLRVVELAQQILATTMDPGMNLLINSLQFHFCSCLKVAVDLRIADSIPKDGSVSVKQLAAATGAHEALLVRIMRILTTKYVFAEPEPHRYSHTAMSWMMRGTDQKYLLNHRLDEGFRSASRQADALKLSGYREPVVGDEFGFNLAFGSNDNFWEYITNVEPKRGADFNHAMKAVNINSLSIIPELYPFDKLAATGGLIVDVGGGLGQVGREILQHYPGKGLQCVVQDQFAPVNSTNGHANGKSNGVNVDISATSDHDVTLQRHNFFDPQPIKGASAYFLRHIFHDWPDHACMDILRQIVPAMDKDRSRILICDQVMNEEMPTIPSILYDIDMMSMFGGKERQLSEWEVLITKTDNRLRIADVWKSTTSPTAIIEVRLR